MTHRNTALQQSLLTPGKRQLLCFVLLGPSSFSILKTNCGGINES